MPPPAEMPVHHAVTCQEQFQLRWSFLHDPHVRALAWLLDAPGLLDAHAPRWQACIATLGPATNSDVVWLKELDARPHALHAAINTQPSARLGRYAEKLLTFYLQQTGRLIAHNVQVRNGANDTVGEFDFLVRNESGNGAVHWEFATKFYLLESVSAPAQIDAFVGPNLADSLGAKMDKIMHRQLKLSVHPASARYLTLPVTQALALVKGWLFYYDAPSPPPLPHSLGVSQDHCRGFWCELPGLNLDDDAAQYLILSRLEWLAPARSAASHALTGEQMQKAVSTLLDQTHAPVMIAVCRQEGDVVLEQRRGFVVPGNWRENAAQRVRHAVVKYQNSFQQ